MQLMATTGHEYSETPGLDWVAGDVVKITPEDASLKVPHNFGIFYGTHLQICIAGQGRYRND